MSDWYDAAKKHFNLVTGESHAAFADAARAFYDAGGDSGGGDVTVSWDDIEDKPTTFAPTIGTTASTALAGNTAFVPPTRTVNAKALSANVVLAGSDLVITGYAIGTAAALAATDTVNAALAKLEARVLALESA